MESEKDKTVSRRGALKAAAGATATAFTIVPRHVLGGPGHTPPSEQIVIAGIGTGGQGIQNLEEFARMKDTRVTAVCDVERERPGYVSWTWGQGKDGRLGGREPAKRAVESIYAEAKPSGSYKGVKTYSNFRELLEKEDIDGVMVATPDHNHAVVTMAAIRKKRHVYCEKPLTWSIKEARTVARAAKEAGVATQMGNQGQAKDEARMIQEYIMDGAIGHVREVRVWTPARFWALPPGMNYPTDTPPVPDSLDWDLWLGPTPERPWHPLYHPWVWRNWWQFGTGLFGDLGAHKLSTVFKALKLEYPTAVEAFSTYHCGEAYPHGVQARFEFPARGDMPPVTINWSDGGIRPQPAPHQTPGSRPSDVTYIGENGTLAGYRLLPRERQKEYGKPPQVLPRSPGHYREWIEACKGGEPAGSNFVDHSGVLTETCLLGNVALRAGKRITWDGPNMKTTPEDANQFLHRDYREGWTL